MTNKQCNFASNNNIHFFSEKSAAKFGIVFIIFLVWIKNIIMYSKVLWEQESDDDVLNTFLQVC